MKAVILAAGQGTRLRPVTLTMPKPLVPVANKSLIEYAIDVLKNAGLSEVGIVVNDLSSPIVAKMGDGADHDVSIEFIVQEEQLGLAHAINLCKDFVGDDTFCVFLGDNIFQDQVEDLLRGFEASDSEAAIALVPVPDPERFGIAFVEGDRIVKLEEKPANPSSNLAISGVYLFRSSIFEAIKQIKPSARGELEITDAMHILVQSDKKVFPYTLKGWWIDAGKPNAIINANQLVLGDMPYTPAPEGENIKDSEVSHRVIVGENTTIVNSVVRGPVIIGDNVTIENSYIGPYTSIGDNVKVQDSEIEASIVMKNCELRQLSGRIDSSLLADNTVVASSAARTPAVYRFILAENSYVQL